LVGGVSAGYPWYNSILNRGESGAVHLQSNGTFSQNPTDVAPWGGTLFFDTNEQWNFSTTDSSPSLGKNFLSVALHEIGHVLGLGITGDFWSWNTLTSGDQFEGTLTASSNQGIKPQISDSGFHWSNSVFDSETTGVFGRPHGSTQEPVMRRVAFAANLDAFAVCTDLELAALQDIGWDLNRTPQYFQVTSSTAKGTPTLQIPSTTGFRYSISGGDSPANLTPLGVTLDGNGTILNWSPPAPFESKAFYRIEVSLTVNKQSASRSQISSSLMENNVLSQFDLPAVPPADCRLPVPFSVPKLIPHCGQKIETSGLDS
jgi:hypothetical protein